VAYNVIEDSKNSYWAGTDNGAYRYFLDEVRFYPLPEVVNERVLVTNVYGEVHFLLPNSLYHYISDSDTILPASLPELPNFDHLEFLLGNDGLIWVRSSFAWHVLNGEQFVPMLPYLDLFEDIRHLSTDADGNIYVIDKGENVYSLEHRNATAAYNFNVYIRKVADANGQPFVMGDMKIITDGSSLIFSVSAPFYLKNKGTEYQYRIDGMRDSWSRWTDETEIDPGNIPPGDYVLQVRARNILGEVSEVKTLAFSVPKPLYLRWYFILLYVLALVLVVWLIIKTRERSLRETQRILEDKVAQRTADLAQEKERAEQLLLNILPKETADELQTSGKATARHYNQVSVLFTDFKGFTSFAENTKPQDLVNELHRCFVKFDEIIGKYYLEKIKTIGDAYMCAGGVPIRNSSNAIAITLAALEIRDFMEQVAAEKRAAGEPILEIRIGIHTGPLTAGVVGMKKFAYDIWGDTVNTASRMESSSEPGKVNVSGTTHEMIKKYFDTEYRGQKEAKGKGLIEMYFVNSIKPEFSENGDGKTPNKGLWELIN
jgi:class 3 adenylate cyclase